MTQVVLPDHPFHECDAMEAAPERIDDLAEEYLEELEEHARGPADMKRFLLGFVPLRVHTRVFTRDSAELRPRQLVWMNHLVGYFGGVWLRAALRTAQPDSPIAKAGQAPSEQDFLAIASRADDGRRAAIGNEAESFAHLERILPELVSGYGYNLGYLLEILERPPEGMRSPPNFAIDRGTLWCDHTPQRLPALAELRPVARRLETAAAQSVGGGGAGEDERWRPLCTPLPEMQSSSVAMGRQVWSTGLSAQGLPQATYDQLLDVSGSFLEIVQATALKTVQALGDRDVEQARCAALADAVLTPLLGSYRLGLMDSDHDDVDHAVFPHFSDDD